MERRIRAAITPMTDAGEPPGVAWSVSRGDETAVGAVGVTGPRDERPVTPETVFRISSTTKPVVATAALALLDDGTLGLDDPVERWLPELADRTVLRDPAGPLDEVVPAHRPVTVRDVLDFRLGIGLDFAGPWPGPVLQALADAGLGAGPPAPQSNPDPDTWIRTVASVPWSHQPGARWLYHVGAEVLGVLIARAAGAPLPEVLADRVVAPLGMAGTGFGIRPDQAGRLGPLWLPGTGELGAYDPADGQWSRPPRFPNGGDGLVSTVEDLHAFGAMLLRGGTATDGTRVIAKETIAAATQARVSTGDGSAWGLGLGVLTADAADGRRAGTYGWDGGLGSSLWIDPASDVVAVLLTNQMWPSPQPPAVFEAFWRAVWAAD
ncbi:UNVERIFIED_CONTAM: hypothetical protein LK11_04830 [Mumia flava]